MITDSFLYECAKAFNGESFVTPAYVTVGTGTTATATSATNLSGPTNDVRASLSKSRSLNELSFSGTRSGADVSTSAGEYLNELGIFSAISGGTMLSAITLPSLLHTTTFDIDISGSFTWGRS